MKVLLHFKADSSIANGKNELPMHRAASSDKNIEVRVQRAGERERESEREREREKTIRRDI